MSECSTETESMSGGEEEMAMMSITDVIPVSKNLGEMVISEKKPVERPAANSVKGGDLKNGEKEEQGAVARSKDFLSHNGVDVAAKNRSITRSDGEFGSGKMPVKKEGEGHGAPNQMLTIQEQMMILRKEQCR